MSRSRCVALLTCSAFLGSGCASMGLGGNRGVFDDANWTCVIIGGLLGGAAGAVAANPNHGDDDENDARLGAGIGLVVGALVGRYVCGDDANQPPTAQLTAEPRSGDAPLEVSFRGAGQDADGTIASYAWDFGDGGMASSQHGTHLYSRPGTYTATLRVTDDDGATGTASIQIQVGSRAQPAPSARRIVLRGINFAFDSARIEPEFEPVLDVAVDELKANPGVSVEVSGHTDSTGPDAYNQLLSERRANSVVQYMVGKGIAAGRLAAAGHGESQPVADNATRDGRAQNRRVELNVR